MVTTGVSRYHGHGVELISVSQIMNIIATLSEPHKARNLLEPRTQMLQKGIDECADAARAALQHFDEWKDMAQELSALAFTSKGETYVPES